MIRTLSFTDPELKLVYQILTDKLQLKQSEAYWKMYLLHVNKYVKNDYYIFHRLKFDALNLADRKFSEITSKLDQFGQGRFQDWRGISALTDEVALAIFRAKERRQPSQANAFREYAETARELSNAMAQLTNPTAARTSQIDQSRHLNSRVNDRQYPIQNANSIPRASSHVDQSYSLEGQIVGQRNSSQSALNIQQDIRHTPGQDSDYYNQINQWIAYLTKRIRKENMGDLIQGLNTILNTLNHMRQLSVNSLKRGKKTNRILIPSDRQFHNSVKYYGGGGTPEMIQRHVMSLYKLNQTLQEAYTDTPTPLPQLAEAPRPQKYATIITTTSYTPTPLPQPRTQEQAPVQRNEDNYNEGRGKGFAMVAK